MSNHQPAFTPCESVALLEPLSLRERGRGEGRGSSGVAIRSYPHPSLRATFSRGEKGIKDYAANRDGLRNGRRYRTTA